MTLTQLAIRAMFTDFCLPVFSGWGQVVVAVSRQATKSHHAFDWHDGGVGPRNTHEGCESDALSLPGSVSLIVVYSLAFVWLAYFSSHHRLGYVPWVSLPRKFVVIDRVFTSRMRSSENVRPENGGPLFDHWRNWKRKAIFWSTGIRDLKIMDQMSTYENDRHTVKWACWIW